MLNKKYSEVDIITPKAGAIVIVRKNIWCWCKDGDPHKALIFRGFSIQGNSNKDCAEATGAKLGYKDSGYKLVFVPNCFIPWSN